MHRNQTGCADYASRALVAVQVAGRCHDRHLPRVRRRGAAPGDRAWHRSALPPSFGRAPTSDTCASADSPACLRRLRTRLANSSALSMPPVRSSDGGNSRPRSPRPAADSTAVAAAWRTTSPSEWPYRRGAFSIVIAAKAQAHVGPEAVVSWPSPCACSRPRRRAGSRLAAMARTTSRSAGSVTFRFVGSPGTVATAMPRLSSRAASSVNVAAPAAAKASSSSSRRRGALRRLRRTSPRRSIDVCRTPAGGALERVDDGHDRNRRAVLGGRRGDRVGERRDASGRAASWTSTTSAPWRRRRTNRSGAARRRRRR